MKKRGFIKLFLLGVLTLLLPAGTALAADIYVTSISDDGPGSLREAVSSAAVGDTIIFHSSLNGKTITLTSQIKTEKDLTFVVPDAVTVIISGSANNKEGLLNHVFIFPRFSVWDFKGDLRIQNSNKDISLTGGGETTLGSGGGIYAGEIVNIQGTVSGNTLKVRSDSKETVAIGGGVDTGDILGDLSGTVFGNTAWGAGDDGLAVGGGGGVAANQKIAHISGTVSTNTARASNTNGLALARGGGILLVSGGILTGIISDNTSIAVSGDTATAQGGGVYSFYPDDGAHRYGYETISGVVSGNTATAISEHGEAEAVGGGVYLGSLRDLSGNIIGNTANALSTSANAYAYGGGLYNAYELDFISGNIIGNTAVASSDDANAYAYGGGAYIGTDTTVISGGVFENNQAVATGGAMNSRAEGGAIFVDTRPMLSYPITPDTVYLTLAPTDSDIIFRNNTITVTNGTISQIRTNDIHFGSFYEDDYHYDSMSDACLNIKGGSHNVYLPGGVTVDMNNEKNFYLSRTDENRSDNLFAWGGENIFSTEDTRGRNDGAAYVTLASGNTLLQPGFSLSGNKIAFTLGEEALLQVMPSEQPATIEAAFINLGNGGRLGVDGSFSYGPALPLGKKQVLLQMTADMGNLSDNGVLTDSSSIMKIGAYDYTYNVSWEADNTNGELAFTLTTRALNAVRGGSYAAQASFYLSCANKTSEFVFDRQRNIFRHLNREKEKLPVNYLVESEKDRPAKRREMWFSPLYNSTRTDAQGGWEGSKIKAPGFIAGYDADISETSFFGGAISTSWPDYNAGGTRTDGTDIRLAAYGGTRVNSGLEFSYAASYGWGNFDQKRSILGESYGTNYHNNTFSLGAGVAKSFESGKNLTIRPYASIEYLNVKTDAYNEGNGTYALAFNKQTQNMNRLRLGVDFINEISDNYFKYGLFYLGQYGDTEAGTTAYFTADPSNPFISFGAPLDKNNLGFNLAFGRALSKNAEFSLNYTALFASNGKSQNVNLNFSHKF